VTRRLTGFVDKRIGEWRELVDPDGAPTWRQLVALHRAGALLLTRPGLVVPFTKAEAAAAIDEAIAADLLERRQAPDPAERFDRVCREVVAHVAAHPGCTTSSVARAVRGGRAYVGDRVADLLELGVLVDGARWRGRGRARELWHANNNVGETPAQKGER
jgi:plasmid stabilization system protein ParE